MTTNDPIPSYERAIVVGASMSGMAVARALSGHFREVFVIEKDRLATDVPDHRPGVQQSWHIHNLTLRGQQELDALLPGFTDEAVRLGAARIDYGRDVARCTFEGFAPLFETGFVALSATRALIELAQRRRFFALCENVVMLEGTRAQSLLTEGSGDACRAVGVTTDHAEHPEIRADLVVDCSGRAALWKRWFKAAGVALPAETVVDSRCGYASRFYRPKPGYSQPWKAMTVDPVFPSQPRWGVIVPLEDHRWVVTIGGFNGQFPPSDEAGFLEFGAGLQTPLFSEWLDNAEPLTPVRTFRRLEMRWNHFERRGPGLKRFLAIGDSAWAYNPLYGQGMSIGVSCARVLKDTLDAGVRLDALPERYYPAAKQIAFPPWKSTALLDLAWPETIGKRPWYTMLHRRAGDFFLRACQYDDSLFVAFLHAVHLIKKPFELLSLPVLLGLARFALRNATSRLPKLQFNQLPTPRNRRSWSGAPIRPTGAAAQVEP